MTRIRAAILVAALGQAASPAQPIAVSLSIEPVKGEVVERTWAFSLDRSQSEIERAFGLAGAELGSEVRRVAGGLEFSSELFFAQGLDLRCTYPIVNAKTGGRLHTFASFYMSIIKRSNSRRVAGRVMSLLQVASRAGGGSEVKVVSQCQTDSELGETWATSTGLFEKSFIEAGLRHLGLPADVPLLPPDETLTAFIDFEPVQDFPHGDQVHPIRAKIPGQRADWTLVRRPISGAAADVWAALRSAAESLARIRNEPIVVDEAQRSIEIGSASPPIRAMTPTESWVDAFRIRLREFADGQLDPVVKRRVLRFNDEATGGWKPVPSNGEIERWVLTHTTATTSPPVVGDRARESPTVTVPPRAEKKTGPPTETGDPTPPVEVSPSTSPPPPPDRFHCTVEQVLAMKNAGLSDDQIKASCHN